MIRLTSARIAWRYLRAKKSHSAVGAISIVSICGMAVATAAIVCVLSVFNGFRDLLSDKLDVISPDVIVTPAMGKTFSDPDSLAAKAAKVDGVGLVMPSLTDNALMIFNSQEIPITLKGVDMSLYPHLTGITDILLNKSEWPFESPRDDNSDEGFELPAPAIFSIGAASRVNIYIGETALIFAPRREGRFNPANPAASFITDSLQMVGVFQSNQSQFDDNTIITDLNTVRSLFQYGDEISALEIKTKKGADLSSVSARLSQALGDTVVVKDRLQQQDINFRMIKIEKWVSFLLLFFILLIASFNIISSLSMLVLEKQKSLSVIRAMGMSKRGIGAIFSWESIYVGIVGGIGGIALGVVLCLLQQHYGFLHLTGDASTLMVASYPVIVQPFDLLATFGAVALIAIMTAFITAAFARSRITAAPQK